MSAVENIEFILLLLTRRGLGLCGRVAPPQKASAVVPQETILDTCVKASSGGLACPVIVVSLNDVGNGGKREPRIDGVGKSEDRKRILSSPLIRLPDTFP